MPKYLVQASYIGDGVQGLRHEGGSARRSAVEKACASVGGKLDAFYYAFGDTDVVTIIDLPDNTTAAGVALLIAASGKVDIKTTVLLTPEEIDSAVKVGGEYRPPGG
ncbi:MAG TPA: GYD domain-containing protein [Acidimicrobiales bacterium]|nr:GYD domain-containing protein [Acidimicrobiales bacterium]